MTATGSGDGLALLFLGLDGATWDVLDPLIAEGHLPTFERLQGEGCHGRLASTHPPVTYPAWRVLSSGKQPGRLGVYGWNHPDFARARFVYPNATAYRTRDVWDYLNAAGHRVGVINQPGTYPPPEIDGVFVSGPESQGDDLVRPRSRTDVADRYEAHTHGIATFVRRGDLPRVHQVIGNGFEVAASLAHEVDVLHHVVFLTDTVQHHLWDDAAAMTELWQSVDDGLALLLERAAPERVVLASDHGFQKLDALVSVNAALAEAGLARLHPPRGASLLGRVGVDRARVLRLAGRLGLSEERVGRLTPTWLKDRVPEATGGLGTRREAAVDWARTVALSGDGRGVHLAESTRIDEAREALAGLSDANGRAYFERVVPGSDVWEGPYLDLAPDLYIEPRDGVEPGGGVGTQVVRTPVPGKTWIAHHHPHGIFLAWGENVRQGTLAGAGIADVMPTMLAALDAPIPDDIDGQALAVFSRTPSPARREPLRPLTEAGYSEDEAALIEKRLEDLGYL